jgi:RNA polymerase sigma-70 factor, ECF subfamily
MERRLAGQMVGRSIMTLLPGLSAVGASEGPLPTVPAAPRAQTFRDFYHAHVEFVWRGARRLGVEDAAVDDVVQHVFLVAYRRFSQFRLHDFPGGGSAKAWVFAILVRVVREYRRSTRRKSPHFTLPHTDPETLADSRELGPHEAFAKVEAARLVRRLLEELDDDKREVFVLAELEQLTTLEIASVLGVNPSTVSSRLRAARRDFERAAERHRRRDTWRLG